LLHGKLVFLFFYAKEQGEQRTQRKRLVQLCVLVSLWFKRLPT